MGWESGEKTAKGQQRPAEEGCGRAPETRTTTKMGLERPEEDEGQEKKHRNFDRTKEEKRAWEGGRPRNRVVSRSTSPVELGYDGVLCFVHTPV